MLRQSQLRESFAVVPQQPLRVKSRILMHLLRVCAYVITCFLYTMCGVYIYTYIYEYIYMYIQTDVYIYTYIYIHMNLHMSISTNVGRPLWVSLAWEPYYLGSRLGPLMFWKLPHVLISCPQEDKATFKSHKQHHTIYVSLVWGKGIIVAADSSWLNWLAASY